MRSHRMRTAAILVLVTLLRCVAGCDQQSNQEPSSNTTTQPTQPVVIRIGYRGSLAGEFGEIWAHEAGALEKVGISSETKDFPGPAAVIISAINSGSIDVAVAVPLEPLLEELRLEKAQYKIHSLLCFSPTDEFDAIFVAHSTNSAPRWSDLSGKALGVLPTTQQTLIGKAIVADAGVDITVRAYNPASPLSSLDSGDFAAVHLLGAPVARAKAQATKYAMLDPCPTSRRLFGGHIVPAGASIISDRFLKAHPDVVRAFLAAESDFSLKCRVKPPPDALVRILAMDKYGGFSRAEIANLSFPPIIPNDKITGADFAPLLEFLETNGVPHPTFDMIARRVYRP